MMRFYADLSIKIHKLSVRVELNSDLFSCCYIFKCIHMVHKLKRLDSYLYKYSVGSCNECMHRYIMYFVYICTMHMVICNFKYRAFKIIMVYQFCCFN